MPASRSGARAADLKPHVPARRLPSLQPKIQTGSRVLAIVRRVALAAITLGGAVLALLALQKIGLGNIAQALVTSSPAFVLLGLAIMCSAMAAFKSRERDCSSQVYIRAQRCCTT